MWVEPVVWVALVCLVARVVLVTRVAPVCHSPRRAVPVDVPTGSTSLSTEAARPMATNQPQIDTAAAPVATP